MDFKAEVARVTGVPVAQQMLLLGGTELKDEMGVAHYSPQSQTIVTLVLRALESLPTPAFSPTIPPFVRHVPEPLPLVDVGDIPIPRCRGELVEDIYVWCTHTSHQPLEGLPQELQRGHLKVRCASCRGEAVAFDGLIRTWSEMLSSHGQPPRGECFQCEREDQRLEFFVRCRGERALADDGRSVCRQETTDKLMFLPCVITNEDQQPSIDTFVEDPVQIEFFPCRHRMSAAGLPNYLRSLHPRNCLVRNAWHPDVFGSYNLKCMSRDCGGVLTLPTCRVGGLEAYRRIKDWGQTEALLARGGVLCCACHTSYLPEARDAGPQRRCPNCHAVFCEQHNQLWEDCMHSDTPEKMLKRLILDAFVDGQLQRCPRPECRFAGQKDGACTHITCVCGHKYCYFCAQPLVDDWCPRGCPWWLERCPLTSGAHLAEMMAKFHKLKCLRLLRSLRRTHGAILFDPTYHSLSLVQRQVVMFQENDASQSTLAITIEEIRQQPPRMHRWNRHEPTTDQIQLTDYP